MAEEDAGIAAKLLALRCEFSERLASDLTILNTLMAEACRAQNQSDTQLRLLEEVHQRLHKLAGSAGTFGFAELGKQARQLELQVQQWRISDAGHLYVLALAVTALGGLMQAGSQVLDVPSLPLAKPSVRQTHIYVVEADAHIAEELCLTLRHFGHQATCFADLQILAGAIRKERPDLLVVDMLLRADGRDSPHFIADLQQQLAEPLPVIFVSSCTDFAAYHAAAKAGAIGYFVKPLDSIRLVDSLENYLERRFEAAYRVLIVDDDQALSEHYRLVLMAAGMQVEVVSHPEKVLLVLRDFNPEIILLDLNIPAYSGSEIAKVIRLCDEWLRVPITYLSSETNIDQRVKAMEQGGDDFISKPISDRELIAAVSIRASRSRQLCNAIDRDSLTGLLKHARIKEQIEIDLARTQRTGEWLSVAMIDLDNFKVVNDTYGHAAGDKVIKAVAHLLRQRLRKTDSIGRYGGEEFVVVLPGCNAAQAQCVLDEVRENFKQIGFTVEDKYFTVTLSAGIASMEATRTINAEAFLQMADDALYLAKHGGRDQIRVA